MTIDLPKNNSIIEFTRTPNGSYAKVGEKYQATTDMYGIVRLQNTNTGSGTFDTAFSYRHAVWEEKGQDMTPSEYIKAQGLPSLAHVARMTGWDRRTLYKFHDTNFPRFEIIVAGCVSKGEDG